MAAVWGKQENILAWVSMQTVLLSTVLMWLPVHHCMITSDIICAGNQLSLTCTDGWLIHIVYETYSYSTSPCSTDPGTVVCTKAEFLDPLSVGHCNGRDSCSFTVPSNTTISSCNHLATALSVHYKCIPETSVFTICSDVTFHQTEQLFLATPDFPSNILARQKNCSCTLIGQNINGTVLQQSRDPNSSVILTMSTNRGTHHINGLNILNTNIFSNLTEINLMLESLLDRQVFKIWLGFRGIDMSLKCQYDKPYPVTTPGEVTVNTSIPGEVTADTIRTGTIQISLDSKISVTPTQTISSQSKLIHCSETEIGQNIKCKSDTTDAIGISSGDSVPGSGSTQADILPTAASVDLSSQIKSTMQVTMATKDSPTKSVIHTKTMVPTNNTHIQPSTAVGDVGTSRVLESLGTSITTENQGISTPAENYTWTSVINTAANEVSSSIILNSNQSSAGLQPNSADKDVVLLVIVGCLAFILLVAMIVFTIFMWRRANTNQYLQEDTHIYDAYHHDNGCMGPDALGDNQSYPPADDQESILI